LTIVPLPRARMPGSTARIARTPPKTLVSNIVRIMSSVRVSMGARSPMPALFTSTSMRPASETACATALSTECGSVTSSGSTESCRCSARAASSRGAPARSGDRIVA